MAESLTTKTLFASAFKELLLTFPYAQISIREICERCNMNRKSFYYHFKDKEDLVCWIFDSELSLENFENDSGTVWDKIALLTQYFYDNKGFYRKVLRVDGQNSFSEHLQEVCSRMVISFSGENRTMGKIQCNFFSDALVCAIKRWILSREPIILPSALVEELKECLDFAKV